MKKVLVIILFYLCLTMFFVVDINAENFAGQVLTIYNVEDYISSGIDGYTDIIGDFEKQYGVKVNYYTYDTNETMYNQFTLQKEGTYDLICTSDYMIQKMIKEDLVIPFDDISEKIPNYDKYAAKLLREKLQQMKVPYHNEIVNLDEFAVGYMWGTLGIVYDPNCSDTIREDVKSWNVFWDDKYKDLISIKNSLRDAFVVGLMHSYQDDENFNRIKNEYLNNPTKEVCKEYNDLIQDIFDFKLDGSQLSNDENNLKISNVKEQLISLKKNIFGFEVDSGKNDIITGRIKMNLAYSGDAVYSIDTAYYEANKELEYFVPLDGSNIWYDAWTLPKGSNKELAYAFLNYLSDPINAANNMDYIGYTPYIVGDDLFTLTGSYYGATEFDKNGRYSAEDETMVIYNNQLYTCIKDKPSELIINTCFEEYFESCEFDPNTTYEEGDMVSYGGNIYNCIQSADKGLIEDSEYFEIVVPYNLNFLFGDSLISGRNAFIYPFLGSLNQLETQYPSEYIISRCAIMNDFGDYNENVVIMWGQVKAYTNMVPVYIFLIIFIVVVIFVFIYFEVKHKINLKYKKRIIK